MTRARLQRISRRWHRVLAPLVGVQLFLWTLGGIYFSWFDLDDVHGDLDRAETPVPDLLQSTDLLAVESFLESSTLKRVKEVRFGWFLDRIVVRLFEDDDRVEMYDARTGERLSPISEDQARTVAEIDFAPQDGVTAVGWVEGKRGEYKKAVPAYRVEFGNWKRTHVYVHANTGLVTARRNSIWRGFDFMWMLHILDFNERENINNWLLRILSLLGMMTVLSGYFLWLLTSTPLRPRRDARGVPVAGKKNPGGRILRG